MSELRPRRWKTCIQDGGYVHKTKRSLQKNSFVLWTACILSNQSHTHGNVKALLVELWLKYLSVQNAEK